MPLTPILAKRLPPPSSPRKFQLDLGPVRGKRHWRALATSVALHAVVIALALGLIPLPALRSHELQVQPSEPKEQVQLIPLTPPEEQQPEPEPVPERPPPEEEQKPPQLIQPPVAAERSKPIDVEDFPDVVDELASQGEQGDQGATEEPALTPSSPEPVELARAPTMEEEARRIFGRRGRRGAGNAEREEWTGPLPGPPTGLEKCEMPPLPQPRPGEPEPQSTARGRILAEDNVTPLSGAHLQVIGQPYSTFSTSGGEYRLTIPRKLVEDCRIQYVRVSYPGFRSRLLPLSLGLRPESEDVALRRR